jgi:hypothetical protein
MKNIKKQTVFNEKAIVFRKKTEKQVLTYQPQLQNFYMDSTHFIRNAECDGYVEQMFEKYGVSEQHGRSSMHEDRPQPKLPRSRLASALKESLKGVES